mmetsp:Transcript_10824/g.15616  ORF Transcript_10824/g.15616 Transcript_10824/m.15616 type:complete len:211 (+) Transcript_10824:1831-2463(+)
MCSRNNRTSSRVSDIHFCVSFSYRGVPLSFMDPPPELSRTWLTFSDTRRVTEVRGSSKFSLPGSARAGTSGETFDGGSTRFGANGEPSGTMLERGGSSTFVVGEGRFWMLFGMLFCTLFCSSSVRLDASVLIAFSPLEAVGYFSFPGAASSGAEFFCSTTAGGSGLAMTPFPASFSSSPPRSFVSTWVAGGASLVFGSDSRGFVPPVLSG